MRAGVLGGKVCPTGDNQAVLQAGKYAGPGAQQGLGCGPSGPAGQDQPLHPGHGAGVAHQGRIQPEDRVPEHSVTTGGSMTKQELIKAVTQTVRAMDPQRNVTAVMVEATLDALVDVTAAELLGGGEVTLPRLGKFKSKAVAARKVRNPRTGEILEIPAGKKLVFITCKELKEAMRS